MTQLALTYPHRPGCQPRDTSADAGEKIADRAVKLRDMCVLSLLLEGPMSADECATVLNESILSIRPRFTELSKMNLIVDSGERRKNASGRNAIVWKLTTEERSV